jgi:hypothetical protein
MPAKTTIKLRAGTQSGWASTAMTQALTSSLITTDASGNLVARYTITGSSHTITVGQVLTITGVTVASGNLPYNISGGVVSGIATTTFDIKVPSGTTAGAGSGGSAVLVVLAAGEAAVETDTASLKIGDGVTDWTNIPYTNRPSFYLVTAQQQLQNVNTPQDLFTKRLSLIANSNYKFKIQVIISGISTSVSKNIQFYFKQSGSGLVGWNFARFQWSGATDSNFGNSTNSFMGSGMTANQIDTAVDLYTANTNSFVYFTIEGTFQTGNGASYFEPVYKFSATPGSGVYMLAGSYATVERLSDKNLTYTGAWS